MLENKYDYKTCFNKGYEMLQGVFSGGSDGVPFVSQMSEFAMAYVGATGKEFYSNPEMFVEGNLRTSAELGFDVPDLVWDVYNIECEALGGTMSWFDEVSPAINNTVPIIRNEKDLAALKPPDPLKSGRMPFIRQLLHLQQELTGRPPTIRYCGPFTLVSHCLQFEQLILRMDEDPSFVHKVFKFIVEEVQAPYINALFKEFPDAGCNGSDAIGSLPFVTEEILEEYSIPYILRLRELCDNRPNVQVDNWWGDSFATTPEKFWDMKLQVTPNYLKIQDPDLFQVGTQRARDYADQAKVPLQFGVDNHVLQEGPEEEIVKRIHEYMEVGSSGPNGSSFFLYLCNLSAETPPEHAKIALDAIRRWRAGDRPYAGQVFSGEEVESSARAGDKGRWMGIGQIGDLDGNMRAALEAAAKEDKKEIFSEIYDSVMEYRDDDCAELVAKALDAGETPGDILDEGLIAAMDTIGDLFSRSEIFVPEMLISARAMKAGLEVLRPILTASKEPPKGTIVMATVRGDLHDIGKNLVCMMLEGAGFKIIDLGVNTNPMSIMEEADNVQADIIGLSALLTTSMPFMMKTIEAFKREERDYPIIVGGAPVTRDYANTIGATGYADNAVDAVVLCKELVAKAKGPEEHAV